MPYPALYLNPCLKSGQIRDYKAIADWADALDDGDAKTACIQFAKDYETFNSKTNTPSFPSQPQGCVDYSAPVASQSQLCTETLQTNNCDIHKGDITDGTDIKRCKAEMFYLPKGFTITRIYLTALQGAVLNTTQTLDSVYDGLKGALSDLLKTLLKIGIPIVIGIIVVIILINVFPSLIKSIFGGKSNKQELVIKSEGSKFKYRFQRKRYNFTK